MCFENTAKPAPIKSALCVWKLSIWTILPAQVQVRPTHATTAWHARATTSFILLPAQRAGNNMWDKEKTHSVTRFYSHFFNIRYRKQTDAIGFTLFPPWAQRDRYHGPRTPRSQLTWDWKWKNTRSTKWGFQPLEGATFWTNFRSNSQVACKLIDSLFTMTIPTYAFKKKYLSLCIINIC